MLGQPILWASAVLIAGVCAARAWLPSVPFLLAALVGASLLLAWAWRRRWGLWWAASLLLFFTGALSQALHPPPPPVETCSAEGTLWRGTVAAPVERAVNPVTREVRQRTALGELQQLCDGAWHARAGTVSVSLNEHPALRRGDAITINLAVEPFAAPLNPVGPDPRVWAHGRGLAGRGRVMGPHAVHRFSGSITGLMDAARLHTATRIEAHFPAEVAPLAKALVTGDRGGIDPDQRERWSKAGLSHLLAISGLHVGLIAGLAFSLIAWCLGHVKPWVERSSVRRSTALLTLPVVVGYCIWVGAPTSAVRATIMAGAGLLGLILARRGATPNALGLAALLIVLWNPASLSDLGFLLSFAAVAGLLLMPRLPPASGRTARMVRWLGGAVMACVVSSVATAPFLADQMGQVSLVAPLTNLVAVPVGTVLAVPGLLLWVLLSSLWPNLPTAPFAWPLQVLDWIARVGTDLPGAWVDVVRPGAAEWLACAAATLTAMLALRRGRGWRWPVTCVGIFIAVMTARTLWPLGDGKLHVYHPYVGQGDAAVVVSPEGKVMVFDAGGAIDPGAWDPGRAVVGPWLRALGAQAIDLAVVSHPDPDHLNGFDYLSRNVPIRELWWTGAGEQNPVMTRVRQRVSEGGGVVKLVRHLPASVAWGGITLEVLHPRPNEDESEGLGYYPGLTDNDNSVVLVLRHGQRSALLPGDLEREAEALVAPRMPQVDWIKAPHHGSRTSSTPALVEAVRARVLVISCGVANRFGFPSPEVLERWRASGAAVMRTDLHGAIEAVSDGRRWWIRGNGGETLQLNP